MTERGTELTRVLAEAANGHACHSLRAFEGLDICGLLPCRLAAALRASEAERDETEGLRAHAEGAAFENARLVGQWVARAEAAEARLAEVEKERDEAKALASGWHKTADRFEAELRRMGRERGVAAIEAKEVLSAYEAAEARIETLEGALREQAEMMEATGHGDVRPIRAALDRRGT